MLKKVLCTGVILCLMLSTVAFASGTDVPANATITSEGSEVSPYTMYYLGGSINFTEKTASVNVRVTTEACMYIDKITHVITIYKNGVQYHSGTYSDTDVESLITTIPVSTKAGDLITVDVTHYTKHNDYLESDTSSAVYQF